jgi:hypothetical protein
VALPGPARGAAAGRGTGPSPVADGIRREFMKNLQTSQISRKTRRIVERLGMVGTTARGAAFALVGVLVIDAAVTFKPSDAGGRDKAR